MKNGRQLIVYVLSAYAISWLWTLRLIVTEAVIEYGKGWPTHFPALLGPMLAAVLVTFNAQGHPGLRDLAKRMLRWRVSVKWWFWAVGSPLLFLGLGLIVVRASTGRWPVLSSLDRFNGLPAIGVVGVWVLLTLASFGEETGWRGFAIRMLQKRFSPLVASLVVAPFWALWHIPYFFVVPTFKGFSPVAVIGFVIGLTCGSIVLTWLYNRSGESILIVAVWHGTYNLVSGAEAVKGRIAAVVSTMVMLQAFLLVVCELRARRRGLPSVFRSKKPKAD
jgi:CAAX protease family protein